MGEIFDFEEQRYYGDFHEKQLCKFFPDKFKLQGKTNAYDLIHLDKYKIELKSEAQRLKQIVVLAQSLQKNKIFDSYTDKQKGAMKNITENFFIESFSDIEKKKVGGPEQSSKKDVHFFIFYRPEYLAFWVFVNKELTSWMTDENITKYFRQHSVDNKGWVSKGYIVPILGFKYKELRWTDSYNQIWKIFRAYDLNRDSIKGVHVDPFAEELVRNCMPSNVQ